MADVPNDFRRLSLLLLVLLAGGYVAVVVASARGGRRLLVPFQLRKVPWSAIEVVLACFLTMFFWQTFVYLVMDSIGVIESVYGEDIANAIRERPKTPEGQLAHHRVLMLTSAVAFPIDILSILYLLRFGSGTTPDQLGFTRQRAGPNALLGTLTFLVITPIVLGVFWLARLLTELLGADAVSEHPFTELTLGKGLPTGEMILLTLLAVIRAPVTEELIFRGLIQPWCAVRKWGGHIMMAIALVVAAFPFDNSTLARLTEGPSWQDRVLAASPALFVLLLVPAYLLVWRKQTTPVPTAIFGTSLLFATIHKFAWPAPVPLFVLGLGLGWLAHRTQSLVAPIVLHALFNAINCVELWRLRAGG